MKKILFFIGVAVLFAACENNGSMVQYKINEPVFMPKTEFRNSVNVTNDAKTLTGSGKICFYNGFLYISDPGNGVHIVNNTDPANPKMVGYIELPGNYDINVRNDILYADALIDLVWFDITDPAQPVYQGRLEDAFPELLPPVENEYGIDFAICYNEEKRKDNLVVGWKVEKRIKKVENYDIYLEFDGSNTSFANSISASSNGLTGSMSRFSLYDNYLYAVINYTMCVFDLSSGAPVKAAENISVGNVETIFSYKDKMFLGTPTGMQIWSVKNPLNPTYCSCVWHVYGCDPVIVHDDLAYVTIHSGNFCGQDNNELFIMDVSDVYHPKQLVSYAMTKPKGLGIDNGALFLCDNGLKVFKIDQPETLLANTLAHIKGMEGYDVIPFDNVLMMIADDGLYQYDYTDVKNMKKLSVLPIKK
ncbi:hypothetical protein LJC52_00210 [Bacteroidales bacterium OttesenSCG-928-A17]|nr:hypothetical protein [Bacteroidales bacterium OttesenSCG-928-A17]